MMIVGRDDEREIELPGFTTRHHVTILTDDWRTLVCLLSWLSEQNANVKSVRQSTVSSKVELSLGVEEVEAEKLRGWLHDAQKTNRILSGRIEHILTRITALKN